MFVEQVMTSPATTVEPITRIGEAWSLMQEGRFRHLPVVEDGVLVGMVSDRDLQLAIARARARMAFTPTIGQIMWRGVVTAAPATPAEEAARLLLEHKIGALPVLDGERLVGIVTESDLFRMLTRLLGVTEPSTRLQLELTSPTRQLAELTRLAGEYGVPIVSLVTGPADRYGRRTVVARLGTLDPTELLRELKMAGIGVGEPMAV